MRIRRQALERLETVGMILAEAPASVRVRGLEHALGFVEARVAPQQTTAIRRELVDDDIAIRVATCVLDRGERLAIAPGRLQRAVQHARYLITNVVDVEPTLPLASATRIDSVCVPRARPVGRSMRRSSPRSSNRPSAVEPSCHG